MTSPATLVEIVHKDTSGLVRKLALEKLTDEAAIAEIAGSAADPETGARRSGSSPTSRCSMMRTDTARR